jgi:hypothetical protein
MATVKKENTLMSDGDSSSQEKKAVRKNETSAPVSEEQKTDTNTTPGRIPNPRRTENEETNEQSRNENSPEQEMTLVFAPPKMPALALDRDDLEEQFR